MSNLINNKLVLINLIEIIVMAWDLKMLLTVINNKKRKNQTIWQVIGLKKLV